MINFISLVIRTNQNVFEPDCKVRKILQLKGMNLDSRIYNLHVRIQTNFAFQQRLKHQELDKVIRNDQNPKGQFD